MYIGLTYTCREMIALSPSCRRFRCRCLDTFGIAQLSRRIGLSRRASTTSNSPLLPHGAEGRAWWLSGQAGPAVSILNKWPGRNLNEPRCFTISLVVSEGIIIMSFGDAMPMHVKSSHSLQRANGDS
jgi:hypothetical protein